MRTAQQPIVAAAEISNVTDFPARAESIATIVTSSSRMNSIVLKLEKSWQKQEKRGDCVVKFIVSFGLHHKVDKVG